MLRQMLTFTQYAMLNEDQYAAPSMSDSKITLCVTALHTVSEHYRAEQHLLLVVARSQGAGRCPQQAASI